MFLFSLLWYFVHLPIFPFRDLLYLYWVSYHVPYNYITFYSVIHLLKNILLNTLYIINNTAVRTLLDISTQMWERFPLQSWNIWVWIYLFLILSGYVKLLSKCVYLNSRQLKMMILFLQMFVTVRFFKISWHYWDIIEVNAHIWIVQFEWFWHLYTHMKSTVESR